MTRSNKSYSNSLSLKLSKLQREVLTGVLLGDGHLEARSGDKTFRLKIEQAAKHRAYVEHLYQIFESWAASPPSLKTRKTKGRSESSSVWFQTISHASFRFYFQQFYSGKTKQVPKLIHRWLTPRAIAYWLMDDGSIKSKQSKGILFNTQGFQQPCVERLIEVLHNKFDLLATLRRQPDGFQIYVSGKSYETLMETIDPFMLDEMRYKLPPPRKTRSG